MIKDSIQQNEKTTPNSKQLAVLKEVNFGRTEIESYLVTKYQSNLLNSESKRKLKLELDHLFEA